RPVSEEADEDPYSINAGDMVESDNITCWRQAASCLSEAPFTLDTFITRSVERADTETGCSDSSPANVVLKYQHCSSFSNSVPTHQCWRTTPSVGLIAIMGVDIIMKRDNVD